MVKIPDMEILNFLQVKYTKILEEGKKDWGVDNPSPGAVRAAKDLLFDLEILERLKIESKEREGESPSPLYCFLLTYYLIRVDEVEYTENFIEAAVETLNKYMGKKIREEGRRILNEST